VELGTAQLLPSLSLMAHAVQVTLAWELSHSSLDLMNILKMFFFPFDIPNSKDNDDIANS